MKIEWSSIIYGIVGGLITAFIIWINNKYLKKFPNFIINQISKISTKFRNKIYRNASFLNKTGMQTFSAYYISMLITFFISGCISVFIIKANALVKSIKTINEIHSESNNFIISVFQIRIFEFFIIILSIYFFLDMLIAFFRESYSKNLIINFEHKMRLLKLTNEERIEFEYQWAKMETKEDFVKIMEQLENIELSKEHLEIIEKLDNIG